MSNLGLGLTTMAIGIVVVFLGLIILIGMIYLMTAFTGRKKPAPPPQVIAPPVVAAPPRPMQIPEEKSETGPDDALIAAVTAAIACVWDGAETGFVVRRIRRVSEAPAWRNAAREEQFLSRMQ